MKPSRRLSVALHALAHLAEPGGVPRTSAELARCVGTNPVVIRRTLAGLREEGIVESVAGAGGGWRLLREPDSVSVGAICGAVGERLLSGVQLAAPTGCRIQAAVTEVMDGFLEDAEAMLRKRLDRITLADLAAAVRTGTPTAKGERRNEH